MVFTLCGAYNLKSGHLSFFDAYVQILVVVSVLAIQS